MRHFVRATAFNLQAFQRVQPTTGISAATPVRGFQSLGPAMGAASGSPYRVQIAAGDSGLWKVTQTEAVARKASELLQEDLEKHHVFFNQDRFHNHIPHHILALYGTGAPAAALQKGYDGNTAYQRPVLPTHDRVLANLKTRNHAKKYIGKEQYYPDFLRFFQREIDARGWEAVVNEYLFSGDAAADDMLVRLFSGFLHPLIQLMYGMEWKQPAIVAEALAQTAVHGIDIRGFLVEAERAAGEGPGGGSIVDLFEAIRGDEKLGGVVRNEDGNKIRDGVLKRARDEILSLAARVRVLPEELEEKTAEMFDACVYMASAAAIHPGKIPKYDFFLIHHVNASPIFLTINAQPWITAETKARLLEWKIRMDLLEYAARAAPPLSLDKIASYQPKANPAKTPIEVVSRLYFLPEDGHTIKLARAALIGRDLSMKYSDKDWMKIKGDDLWMRVFHLIVDSAGAPGPDWVRTCGLEEAWQDVPDFQDAKL
ncbi:HypA protein [Lasiosphaeris hirsuta]|uniref:HypA protein n=1 Tax=Lasiosphaeris hirsuta TaxID=260670 RepID=A0AA40AQ95_9PEZI|nr:HypA protein [Lasiosphaeris hirsuta]